MEKQVKTSAHRRASSMSVRMRMICVWRQDCGGLKEGDVLVPDMCDNVPQAVMQAAHNGTVYVRKGYTKTAFCLPACSYMHVNIPADGEGAMLRRFGRVLLLGRGACGSEAHAHPGRAKPRRGCAWRSRKAYSRGEVAARRGLQWLVQARQLRREV